MKKNKLKIIGLILSSAIVITSGFLFIEKNKVMANIKAEKDLIKAEKEIEKTYPKLLKSNGDSKDKIETTYVISDYNGNVNNVIVSEKLTNPKNEKKLKDYSNLENIENTSGEETFEKQGNELTWDTNGNRIEYKGNTKEELPVKVKISYYLNGEEMSANEIAGKSGKVKIRFDYEVLKEEIVNGKKYKHPYMLASGVMLDNNHFSDINVTSGKAVDDGSKTIVFGTAFPSMNENLEISKEKLDIPDYVEISGFTDKFNISGTYTIALTGILNDIDTTKTDDVKSKLNELKNGLNKLSGASKELLKGTDDLKNGSVELDKGLNELKKGITKLNSGSESLNSGARNLNNGLNDLSKNSGKINGGMRQLEKEIFANATKQIRAELKDDKIVLYPTNYVKVIQGISDGAATKAENELRKSLNAKGIKDKETQNILLSVAYNDLMKENKTEASIEEISLAIQKAGEDAKKADFVNKAINKNKNKIINFLHIKGYKDEQINDEMIAVGSVALELANGKPLEIEKNVPEAEKYLRAAANFKNGKVKANENVKKLSAIAVGKDTPKKLKALKQSLDQIEILVSGMLDYTSGVDKVAAGSTKLLAGINELNTGTKKLENGTTRLANGSKQLREGLAKLNKGMTKFNKDGIEKFVNTLDNNDLNKIINNIENLKKASKNEVFVGGKLDNMTGESKIIFKTKEIEK